MGVDIEVMTPGNGSTFPKAGTKVTCHYVLTLTNGKKNWFFKRPRQAIWVQCWSRRGYCRMGWGTHQDVHWRASKIDHFSWYGLRCQRSARLYSPQLNTGIWCWAVESIVNTRKKKKASQEINAFFCEDVAWFWIRLKPIFETESVIMSIPKFLSTTSELSSTLFDWAFVYKLVIDKSLVDVGKFITNEFRSRRKFTCRRKLLVPISLLNENIPRPTQYSLPQLLLIFSKQNRNQRT